MNARSILSGLFIFEVVIGVSLTVFGLYSGSPLLALIGFSVGAAHVLEKVLLSKV